jgi:hypothetical protein
MSSFLYELRHLISGFSAGRVIGETIAWGDHQTPENKGL